MQTDTLPIYLFSKTPHDEVTFFPVLLTEFIQPKIDFDRYDAIVLTSKQAVVALDKIGPEWTKVPVLTIADITGEMAKASGATVMSRGGGYGETLAEIIINGHSEKRWLYPRPEKVASDFGEKVRNAGVFIEDAIVYKTSCNPETASQVIEDDAVLIFTSPLAIECFTAFHAFKPTHKVVAIGKTTRAALPEGIEAVMPEKPSVDNSVNLAKKLALAGE